MPAKLRPTDNSGEVPSFWLTEIAYFKHLCHRWCALRFCGFGNCACAASYARLAICGGGGAQLLPLMADSRRLEDGANLESEKHASKLGAFAICARD